jgi:TPR repeat protein
MKVKSDMYKIGKGVKQNSKKALEFFGKTCDMKNEGRCENYTRFKKSLDNKRDSLEFISYFPILLLFER